METAAAVWARIGAWWAALPELPDFALPPVPDLALIVVLATVVGGLGFAALASGWAEGRVSKSGLFATFVGAGMAFWVWEAERSLTWRIVPVAFIEMIARATR
ncbi:hypothetical protein [Jannaschia aquimarina]|uniref:Uncharacterized protein n=1 Tax=Jannaschia aquimarina TaxID=935700 RepID=A0A0D1EEQ2_9RHOB|nr:hypothetical protein [Jannaschia aquimarina]KIT15351.1 hypothetical protein jaqu_29660 [Jannaschia aquimarina]SNS51860.1 hypothetical protein SAMN05421775_101280 [Jannaschia aquimarina]